VLINKRYIRFYAKIVTDITSWKHFVVLWSRVVQQTDGIPNNTNVHLSSHRYLVGFVLLDLFCISLFVLLSSSFPSSLLGMIRSRKMTKPYTSSIKAEAEAKGLG
jgi:hypothetical protein